jgi:hypothetical protein
MSAPLARLVFCLVPAILAGALAGCIAPFFGFIAFAAVFGLGLSVTSAPSAPQRAYGGDIRPTIPMPPPPPPQRRPDVAMTQDLYDVLIHWAEVNVKRGYSDGNKATAERELLTHLNTLFPK